MKLKAHEESSALAFGSAIHKGLEHWYQLPTEERVLPKNLEETADCYAYGQQLETPAGQGALESIRQFALSRHSVLSLLPESDKRSLSAGIRILRAYFRHYANDGFSVYKDSQGPVIERRVEFTIHDSPSLQINYFGTIDVVLQHKDTGVIIVTDHKTTSALGSEFYARCNPNFQYSGYVLGARKALGIDTSMFCINGLQVAKTKVEFARQITERTEEDFIELQIAVVEAVQRWQTALEVNKFPMTAPEPCSAYGGCQYRKLCELPAKVRENVIKIDYV